jgi:hypothetical protein
MLDKISNRPSHFRRRPKASAAPGTGAESDVILGLDLRSRAKVQSLDVNVHLRHGFSWVSTTVTYAQTDHSTCCNNIAIFIFYSAQTDTDLRSVAESEQSNSIVGYPCQFWGRRGIGESNVLGVIHGKSCRSSRLIASSARPPASATRT